MAEMYRSKGSDTIVEANQILPDTVTAVALWCGGVEVVEHDALQHEVTFAAINVPTIIGMLRAQEGDWIIQRLSGDFYPMPANRFLELFEPII